MFWNVLIELCNEKGISPNFVAKELGITSGTVTSWKKGSVPRDTTLRKIADYFGVSTDYLLGTENEFLQTFAKEKDPPKISESEEQLLALFREVPEADREIVVKMIESALSARRVEKAADEIATNIARTAASIQRPRTFGMYRGRAGQRPAIRGMKTVAVKKVQK